MALNLAREQNDLEQKACIWCVDSQDDCLWASAASGLPEQRIRRFRTIGPRMLGVSREMERAAEDEARNISVVHQHALWTGLSRVTSLLRKRHGIPYVITPHGSLERWARNKSLWKKRLALFAYERDNFSNAPCFHAVGENEIKDIRDFGLRNPIAVIPNGISGDWLQSDGDADRFYKEFQIAPGKRVLLFLSRITPIKGIPMFLEALHETRKRLSGWVFVIAGSDEFDHQREILNVVAERGLDDFVKFVGPLHGGTKRDAFAAADLFVLPSYSEGAPIVILEALGAGVPVLATNASPWQDLKRFECGWLVDISARALAEGLNEALNRSSDDLREMGQRGKQLVASKYTWTKSAQMTIELYEWLLGRRGKPGFVVTD